MLSRGSLSNARKGVIWDERQNRNHQERYRKGGIDSRDLLCDIAKQKVACCWFAYRDGCCHPCKHYLWRIMSFWEGLPYKPERMTDKKSSSIIGGAPLPLPLGHLPSRFLISRCLHGVTDISLIRRACEVVVAFLWSMRALRETSSG